MNNIFQYSEDGKALLSIKDKKVKEVVIPNGITSIGEDAFPKPFKRIGKTIKGK